METPASLLERLRQAAWERLVELYAPLLFAWARRVGCQEADAADLVQDVLTLLVCKLPEFRYDAHGSFRAWLHTVTLNRWRNLRRRAALPREANAPDPDDLPGPDTTEEFREADYRRHLVGRAVRLMRADFQPTTWKACWETAVAGRPAAEVARELGVSVGAVYMARSRVLSRLRRELAGLLD
jgi:RNA polymerase sigma-70 factor (ECF subfamily)